MPLSHLARTHLVYQSLLLALVLSTCHDFLSKVAMFLIVLLYQMLVLILCCTEIIPVPRWLNLRNDLLAANNSQDQRSNGGSISREDNGVEKRTDEVPQMSKEQNDLNRDNQDANVCARKYKLRNWKSPSSNTSGLKHPVTVLPSDISSGISLERANSNQIRSPESTKKYFFPYRQKRLEQWIESKENQRPFKIRNWQSNSSFGQHLAMSSSDITNLSPSKKISELSEPDDPYPSLPENRYGFPIHQKHSIKPDACGIGNSEDCLSVDSSVPEVLPVISELLKRYTFPFRQKPSIDSDNDEQDCSGDYPSTPYWKTVGYSMAVKQEARKRRRSVSSSLLATSKFEHESDTSKDFSQSVEIPRTSVSSSKFNSSSNAIGSTTFAKMKLNFVNCFSKIKRVNSKNNLNKELVSKRRSFKSLFQSRVSINVESNEKEIVLKSDIGMKKPSSDFYPSYIPFQKERFEKDVRRRMLELPQN